MTIDFLNKKFYFESYKTTIDLQEKHLGFSPTIINNKLVVGIVWYKKLKKEISFGDEIIKFDGIRTQDIDVCDFITDKIKFSKLPRSKLTRHY